MNASEILIRSLIERDQEAVNLFIELERSLTTTRCQHCGSFVPPILGRAFEKLCRLVQILAVVKSKPVFARWGILDILEALGMK